MPKSRSIPFVDTVRSQTIGAKSFDMNVTGAERPSAMRSVFFIAIRFGTSSPNTSVMYERMIVISMTESV